MPREYDPETRAAVMAEVLSGEPVGEVANRWDIPVGTVSSWGCRARRIPAAIIAEEKKIQIGILLLEYLEGNLTALKRQVELFGDRTWLRRQDASSLAELHAVVSDRSLRLFEALAEADLQEADVVDAESWTPA